MLDKECIFCRIIKGEIPSQKVYEDEQTMVLNDRDPQAPIHLLVIPKSHISTIHELSIDQLPLMSSIFTALRAAVLQLGLSDAGYRIVINAGEHGGQSVPHLHAHVLAGRALSWPPG